MDELRSLLEACEAEEKLAERASEETRSIAAAPGKGRLIGPYELDRLLGAEVWAQSTSRIESMGSSASSGYQADRYATGHRSLSRSVSDGTPDSGRPGVSVIARLLDGGVSDDGDPYLAMEYVEGISIARYCKERHLSLRDRLLLFKNVCGAVQFAHQSLVVHSDLKPDNILVVGDGTPRLLDFGTAKLLAPTPTDVTAGFTQQGLRSFTPQFASPEQVLGDPDYDRI